MSSRFVPPLPINRVSEGTDQIVEAFPLEKSRDAFPSKIPPPPPDLEVCIKCDHESKVQKHVQDHEEYLNGHQAYMKMYEKRVIEHDNILKTLAANKEANSEETKKFFGDICSGFKKAVDEKHAEFIFHFSEETGSINHYEGPPQTKTSDPKILAIRYFIRLCLSKGWTVRYATNVGEITYYGGNKKSYRIYDMIYCKLR